MSDQNKTCRVHRPFRSGVAILAALLAGAALVKLTVHFTRPAPLAADRAAQRRQALAELRAANADALNRYAWLDQTKGIVRLPIEQAMKLTLAEWQNPEAGRSNLIARAEKAAAPAPRPPEKPSQFE